MFRRIGIFKAGPLGSIIFVISIVLTALILFYFWSWLNPVDFWQKLVAVIVSIISGIILFIIIAMLMFILLMPFFMKRMMRKMMKAQKGKKNEKEKTGYL